MAMSTRGLQQDPVSTTRVFGAPTILHFLRPIEYPWLPIPIDVFSLGKDVGRPGIILLYGANGLTPRYFPLLRYLVEGGYTTFVPRFLALPGKESAVGQEGRRNFPYWLETLTKALMNIVSRPGIDSTRIGLIGVSLGASLGLALAAHCFAVKAIADWYGEIPEFVVDKSFRMPPTLILHGGSDRVVPLQKVRRFALAMRQENIPCELHIYPGERHILRPSRHLDAAMRTRAFFEKYI
jgi:carboxymethylenebutenolidase